MATKKPAAAAAPVYEDEAQYTVTVVKRIDLGHISRDLVLRKGTTATLKGKILKDYLDRVADIKAVTA